MARSRRLTVAEWVRQTLRAGRREVPTSSRAKKLDAIREATRHRFPAPPIDKMLEEIGMGYLSRTSRRS